MKKFVLSFVTGLAIAVTGCGDNTGVENPTVDMDENEVLEPGDVEDGEVPVGKKVKLHGEVSDVYGTNSFALSDDGWDWEDDLIVVSKDALPFGAEEDAEVNVTGTVKAYSVVEIEKEYGIDLDPEVEVELEDTKYYLSGANIEVVESADE